MPRYAFQRFLVLTMAVFFANAAPVSAQQGGAEAQEDRWEKAIRAFEAQDREQSPPLHATLFVGSSSIRNWDLPKYFPGRATINRGFGGSEVADSLRYAGRIILKYKPKQIVVYAGDNDIAHGKGPGQVRDDFLALVKKIHKALPDCTLYYVCIKPSLKRWELWETMREANKGIQRLARWRRRVKYVDIATPMLGAGGTPRPELFMEDGLHLNDAGYKLWSGIVAGRLGGK